MNQSVNVVHPTALVLKVGSGDPQGLWVCNSECTNGTKWTLTHLYTSQS